MVYLFYLLVQFQRRRLVTVPVMVVPLQAVHPEVGLQLGRAGLLRHQALGAFQDLIWRHFFCDKMVTHLGHFFLSTFLTRGLSRGLSCDGGTHFCSFTNSLSWLACEESLMNMIFTTCEIFSKIGLNYHKAG